MPKEAAKIKFQLKNLAQYMTTLLQNRACLQIRTERGPLTPELIGGGNIERFAEVFGRELPNHYGPFLAKRALERGVNLYVARAAHYTDPTSAATLAFTKSSSDLTDRGSVYASVTLGTTQKVKYVSKIAGADGNDISIEQIDPSAPSQSLSVAVTDQKITVNLATDSESEITSTCLDVAGAVNANPVSAALVEAQAQTTGIAEAVAETNLSGGGATAAYASATLGDVTKIAFTSKLRGTDGNSITVTIENPGEADQDLTVTVADKDIIISLETNALSEIISSATEVVEAVQNNITANALVAAEVDTAGTVEAVAETSLSGGVDGTNTLRISAKTEGDWSAYGRLKYKVTPSGNTDRFHLSIQSTNEPDLNKQFRDLSMNPDDDRYAPTWVNSRTELIELTDLNEGETPFGNRCPQNSPSDGEGGYLYENFTTQGAGNANDVETTDIQGDGAAKTGIHVFDEVDDAWILAIPEETGKDVWTSGAGYAANRDGDMVFVHCCPNITPTQALDFRNAEGDYSGAAVSTPYAALYFGHLKVPHPRKGDVIIPGGADAVGGILFSQSKSEYDAPAGLERGWIPNVLQVVNNVGSGGRVTEADALAAAQVNPIASYAGEPACLWDAQTCHGIESPLQDLKTVYLIIMIRKAVLRGNRADLFKAHLPKYWRLFHQKYTDFLSLFPKEALYAYRVECDQDIDLSNLDQARLNTPARREAQEFVAQFFIKPTPSIRTICIQTVLVKQSVSFDILTNVPEL